MTPTRALFFGSGPFALPILARLTTRSDAGTGDPPLAGVAEVVAVVTAPPKPAGRRGALQPTPVASLAEARGIPILTPPTLREAVTLEVLGRLAAELIVLADYGRLIPAALLDLPRHGALNLHPSLLPRHRGAAPVAAAILAGDTSTGVTLMRMDAGLDTGPIVAQRSIPLDGGEVAPALEARLAELAADLLIEALPGWIAGALPTRPQPHEQASLTRPLRRSDGWLDPGRPAVELARQVRAYQPWPGSWTLLRGERLIVWSASVLDDLAPIGDSVPVDDAVPVDVTAPGGDIVPTGDSLAMRTRRGWLRLDEVQPAGRRRMSGAELRRGLRGGTGPWHGRPRD